MGMLSIWVDSPFLCQETPPEPAELYADSSLEFTCITYEEAKRTEV